MARLSGRYAGREILPGVIDTLEITSVSCLHPFLITNRSVIVHSPQCAHLSFPDKYSRFVIVMTCL